MKMFIYKQREWRGSGSGWPSGKRNLEKKPFNIILNYKNLK